MTAAIRAPKRRAVPRPIRVLLVDDHTLVRSGIRALLETLPQIEVVGEASNGREALVLASRRRPNVVLMDVAMPEFDGIETLKRMRKVSPQTRVLMLSMHANDEYVRQTVRDGAGGYLLKDVAATELEAAVAAVARGEMYLSPALRARHASLGRAGAPRPLIELSRRQREVLRLIAEGRKTKEVAAALNVSVKTVETHRMQLMKRLDIHNVAGLVRYAIRYGLVTSEP